MYVVVTTMGIVEVEQNRLRQLEIETQACVALYLNTETIEIKMKCEEKLFGLAFPESLADVIE
jgi:phage-related holin